jgi:hypothetical protein
VIVTRGGVVVYGLWGQLSFVQALFMTGVIYSALRGGLVEDTMRKPL